MAPVIVNRLTMAARAFCAKPGRFALGLDRIQIDAAAGLARATDGHSAITLRLPQQNAGEGVTFISATEAAAADKLMGKGDAGAEIKGGQFCALNGATMPVTDPAPDRTFPPFDKITPSTPLLSRFQISSHELRRAADFVDKHGSVPATGGSGNVVTVEIHRDETPPIVLRAETASGEAVILIARCKATELYFEAPEAPADAEAE